MSVTPAPTPFAMPADAVPVRICDRAGRPRGAGFVADGTGTLITTHEAVDGLHEMLLHTADGRTHLADAADLTTFPECDLALVRATTLTGPPPVIGTERPPGTRVRFWAGEWVETTLGDTTEAAYTSTDGHHVLGSVLRLELPEATAAALRRSRTVTGSPVLDVDTGAVLAVLSTALLCPGHRGLAVPIRDPLHPAPLRDVLGRNGDAAPGFGTDLNLAGVLALAARTVPPPRTPASERVERPAVGAELAAFTSGSAGVLALIGDPGTGRSTELAACAARRAEALPPLPTVWLRGADLRAEDTGLRDAVGRALHRAGRITPRPTAQPGTAARGKGAAAHRGAARATNPDVAARLARDAGRPLLVLLDAPEELPAPLGRELRRWTTATAGWLSTSGARLATACRPEFWEQLAPCFPADLLHRPAGLPGPALPGSLHIADLPHGHPLTHRMRTRLPAGSPAARADAERHDVFTAWLDLTAHGIARRLHAGRHLADRHPTGPSDVPEAPAGSPAPPAPPRRAQRRLAADAADRLHRAARDALGPGRGAIARDAFAAAFPPGEGWAAAVLAEGTLEAAGDGYRFADEEFGDWLQGRHLDVDGALDTLVHHRSAQDPLPVPHHRIGPVVEALLLLDRTGGPQALARRLRPLALPTDRDTEAAWWAAHLLGETLLRLPDAGPYMPVLRTLAARLVRHGQEPGFGPSFWNALPLTTDRACELLRQLLPLDPGPPATGDRFLDAAAARLAGEPGTARRAVCRWFDDDRPLRASGATVATAAQALLHTHRGTAVDDLVETLADADHPRADELLTELAHDEPAAMSRAVARWTSDPCAHRRGSAARLLPRLAERPGTEPDRLRTAAETLLDRSSDRAATTAALAVLVRDPHSRGRHLSTALARFAEGRPEPVLTRALARALATHPEPVTAALRQRLHNPPGTCGPADDPLPGLLHALSAGPAPAAARRAAARLVREAAELRPAAAAEPVAAFVTRLLRDGPAVEETLHALLPHLLAVPAPALRAAVGRALGSEARLRPSAAALLEGLLCTERDEQVLDAVLSAVPHDSELVHRLGLLMRRTAEGAARFDRRTTQPARTDPDFAAHRHGRAAGAPESREALAAPGAGRGHAAPVDGR